MEVQRTSRMRWLLGTNHRFEALSVAEHEHIEVLAQSCRHVSNYQPTKCFPFLNFGMLLLKAACTALSEFVIARVHSAR